MPTIPTNSGYTIQDLLCGIGATTSAPTGGIWDKLSQRTDIFATNKGSQWVADAVINLSRFYEYQDLEETGPTVQMTTNQVAYPLSYFINPTDAIAFNARVPSFYMFYNNPNTNTSGANPGIGLTYKSIDSLELMFSTPGTPAYWTRYGNQIYIAPQPNNSYYSYMRYQRQHPFSKPAALTDIIYLPDEWREIVEYSAAMRGAGNLRMLDYASSYKATLFGDPKKPGDLGLIKALLEQNESDTVSNQGMRAIRPLNGRGVQ